MVKNMIKEEYLSIVIVLMFVFLVFTSANENNQIKYDKENVKKQTVDYIKRELKGGENVTFNDIEEVNSTVFKMDIEFRNESRDIYVTKDAKNIFFCPPTKME